MNKEKKSHPCLKEAVQFGIFNMKQAKPRNEQNPMELPFRNAREPFRITLWNYPLQLPFGITLWNCPFKSPFKNLQNYPLESPFRITLWNYPLELPIRITLWNHPLKTFKLPFRITLQNRPLNPFRITLEYSFESPFRIKHCRVRNVCLHF